MYTFEPARDERLDITRFLAGEDENLTMTWDLGPLPNGWAFEMSDSLSFTDSFLDARLMTAVRIYWKVDNSPPW